MRLRFSFVTALAVVVASSCRTAETNYHADSSEVPSELVARDPEPTPVAPAAQPAPRALPAIAPAFKQEPPSQDDAERLRRQQERARVLAAEYLRIGDQRRDQGDLQSALSEYSKALEVDPSNAAARERLASMKAALGDR